MAARIDRVEKEFILGAAAEEGASARIHAPGRTFQCKLARVDKDLLRFAMFEEERARLVPWERVQVQLEFRGQPVAFSAPVKKAASGFFELAFPDTMYRALSRRWPRVAPPEDFAADLLLPGADLRLSCPECREYTDPEPPPGAVAADSFAALVAEFKEKAELHASESRVTLWKAEKGPADPAEAAAAALGRVLYLPSTLSGLPIADPYPEGRILTRELLEDFESPASFAGDSEVGRFIAARAREGLASALWCPVLYYRYAVGIVYLGNDAASRRPFDLRSVDFAWDFARRLAWLLKRHGYFGSGTASGKRSRGSVIDASPAGLLLALEGEAPRFRIGQATELLITVGGRSISCQGRVARGYDSGKLRCYGFQFEGLSGEARAELALGLYGLACPDFFGGGA